VLSVQNKTAINDIDHIASAIPVADQSGAGSGQGTDAGTASSSTERTVDLGSLGPVGRSDVEARLRHLATVFGLIP
jgi:hypothetical protein